MSLSCCADCRSRTIALIYFTFYHRNPRRKMKIELLRSLVFLFAFAIFHRRVLSELERASFPPRGWNSYDSFSWIISEQEFLENAEIISNRLSVHGYQYVVVDYLWYRRKVPGAHHDSLGFDVIDEWGRMLPDPGRWPSSNGGNGFTEVAKKVHGMGLKFGIHVMRGLSRQAYDANTPIFDTTTGRAYEESGRQWRARDIGIKEKACGWMPHGFMSVNTKLGAGRAFLRSLYEQYADWGVDFVKHDCIFGDDLDLAEISFVSEVLERLHCPILYSLSPGTSVTPTMAKDISSLVNMYRVTADDWDSWGDVAAHFDVSRDFSAANMTGAKGLLGKSWPDLDMLPLGWLTDPGCNEGPHRASRLNLDEQRTQITLWAMAKSPIMFGGDVRNIDELTFNLITNPTVLEINSFSSNNKEFPYVIGGMGLKTKVSRQSRGYREELGASHAQILRLTSCEDPSANSWSIGTLGKDLDQICWTGNLRSQENVCLYKTKPPLGFDEQVICLQRKHNVYASNGLELCLDSSQRRKPTSKELGALSFSPCRWDASQMWVLNKNGALVSNYSGLCVKVDLHKVDAPNGLRSWIAMGRRGEIYLAFFNLNSGKTTASAKLSDIAKAFPDRNLNLKSCKCRETWSGKDMGEIQGSISLELQTHGCALFVLNCDYFHILMNPTMNPLSLSS